MMPPEEVTVFPAALSHEDFHVWWNELDPLARAEFAHVHKGREVHARYACALDKLNLATLRPGPRGTEVDAYMLAAGCDRARAQSVYRGARSHPGVLRLLRAVAQRDEKSGVATTLPDEPAPVFETPPDADPPASRSAHLNSPQRVRAARKKTQDARADDDDEWMRHTLSLDKTQWTDEQRYYARDLRTLCQEILMPQYEHPIPLDDQPYEEVCAFYEPIIDHLGGATGQMKKMILIPRHLFKTSIGGVGLSIYTLIHFPDAAIFLDSHTWDISKRILAEIKDHMEFNAKFRRVFGDWVTGAKQWGIESIRINRCTIPRREGSIDTAGVNKDTTGGHYNLIICDDLCDRKNTETASGRDLVKRHISTLRPILKLDGVLLIQGTHWHHADAYRSIQKEDDRRVRAGKEPIYEKLIRGAYINGGQLYAPTVLSEAKLEDLRSACTDEDFANWYLNRPIDERSQVFPEGLIRYYDGTFRITYSPYIVMRDGVTKIPVFVTIAWDPAGRKSNKRSAFHGFTVQGMDPLGNRYIMEATELKAQPSEILAYAVDLIREYQPHAVSVEDRGGYGLWIDLLRKELAELEIQANIVEYAPTSWETKISRIKAQQVDFKNRRVFIRQGLVRIVEQLLEFPQLEFFDIVDTLPQHELIARPADPLEAAPFLQAEEDFDAPEDNRTGPRSGSWAGVGTPSKVKRSA